MWDYFKCGVKSYERFTSGLLFSTKTRNGNFFSLKFILFIHENLLNFQERKIKIYKFLHLFIKHLIFAGIAEKLEKIEENEGQN